MRLPPILVAVLLAPAALPAQATRPIEASGVRFVRGDQLPAPFGLSLVGPTADGLVALTVDDRLAGRLSLGREPHSTTEYYLPDDVLQWTAGINSLLSWLNAPMGSPEGPSFTLGSAGVVIEASGIVANGRRQGVLRINRCRESESREPIQPSMLASISTLFRRAALQARASGTRNAPGDAVWYAHAVGCPAIPDVGNDAPSWPRNVTTLRPHQELMQFVVDPNGRVEPGSEQFLASSDPRFTASIRAVLPTWRFKPATRMSRAVRQVMHLSVGFTPPIVVGTDGAACSGPQCAEQFTTTATNDALSILPQGDGTVRIANYPESDGRHLARERSHTAVILSAGVFRRFVDTVNVLLPSMDTTGTVENGPDYGPDSPMVSDENTPGVNMWLSRTGWIRSGFLCGIMGRGTERFFEIRPSEFPGFRAASLAALQRLSMQPAWTTREKNTWLEHELTCIPSRIGHQVAPALPRDQVSRETVVRLTVDERGNVEPSSVETMPGIDSTLRSALIASVQRWQFTPAVGGSAHVRAQTHLNVILRPIDADAVVLATLARAPMPEDTLIRTVFYRPLPGQENVAPLVPANGVQKVLAFLQPYIDSARQSWRSVRERFLNGLPLGSELVVTTMTEDNIGNSAFVRIRVDRVVNDSIFGRVWQDIDLATDWLRGDLFVLSDADLVDWRIVRADGTVEGNFLGRFVGRR